MGSDHAAYVLHFTARDLARFGWLYLNKGKWRDEPPRVRRRPFDLSHAAMAGSSSMA
jgi:CubicO group peptidase (beta-lactamase class C family)